MDSSSFMLLPAELLIRILSFLPFKSIVVCSRISRRFNDIVKTSTVLQYIVELGLSGLVDYGKGSYSPSERLRLLREYEDGWSTLSWRHGSSIPVGKEFIFWELCGGVFAGSYRSQSDIPYTPRSFDMIDIFYLDSRDDTATTIALGKRFCNFSMDPGQDLLVLVEGNPNFPKVWFMHIRSLSDNLAHPNATHEIIEVPVIHESWPGTVRHKHSVETRIMGGIVLFCERSGPGPGQGGCISTFEWTSGKTTFILYSAHGDWDVTLVSEQHLILSERRALRSQPCLQLYDIHPRSKWDAKPIIYLLPFKAGEPWRAHTCYGPASNSLTTAGARGTLRPFGPASSPSLLAFRFIRFIHSPGTTGYPNVSLDMFLIPTLLQNYSGINDIVEWEEWGPHSTRWFMAVLPNIWQRNIQGYRVVLSEKNVVLDFNPNIWTEDAELVCESSQLPSEVTGGSTIVSSLPYRILRPREPFPSRNVLLDDGLVCIETDPNQPSMVKSFQLLSF